MPMMVNRGYSSQSAMYEASKRFAHKANEGFNAGILRKLAIIYLGDFDPSGEDMVRDISDRMEMFGVDIEVKKIALTMDQVKQYNPPPNPAKMSDPRADNFVAEHGGYSWEVDAINPAELQKIITREIEDRIDRFKLAMIIREEESDKTKLRKAIEKP
jgi:hypothetical protein